MKQKRLKLNRITFSLIIAIIILVGLTMLFTHAPTRESRTTGTNEIVQKITYSPENAFSRAEKTLLEKRLILPMIDYEEQYENEEGYDPIKTITITKFTDKEYEEQMSYTKYRYNVTVVSRHSTAERLYGENDTINWWAPECYHGGCGVKDTFKAKYPEIVDLLIQNGYTP
jgi:hypothetical protein